MKPTHLKLASSNDNPSGSGPTAALFAAPADQQVEPHDAMAEEDLARLRELPVNQIVLEYLGTRDQLDNERHAWQAIEADLKERLSRMSMVMREKADHLGVDAFPIRGVGTAYRSIKTSYRLTSWDEFVKWIDETKNYQCLEKRVAKLATAEVEKSTGNAPPGVDKIQEVEFLVRRNSA